MINKITSNPNLKNKRILVVDDTISNVEMIETYLMLEGYTSIRLITDARDVFDVYDEYHPDILLLDITMPYISGLEIMSELRAKTPDSEYLPIIILTADVSTNTKRKALEMGASDFLTKPIDLIELKARLETHLQIRIKTEEIHLYAQELAHQIAIKDKFFSIIAHDVRNPFAGIDNYVSLLLKMKKFSPETYEKELQLIQKSARTGRNLLENLLKWSKTQTGNIKLNKTKVELHTLLAENIEQFVSSAKIKNIRIEQSLESVELESDVEMIDTIFRNLIGNALKFTPQGGLIQICLDKKSDFCEVKISDNGIGMSQREMDKLFSVDSQLDSRKGTSGESGSGLGLILCKEFATLLDGTIRVESEVEKGSAFYVQIPL